MTEINVAVIVGSNRRDSMNRKLAGALAKLADGKLALRIVQIDDLPMYNPDLESSCVERFNAATVPMVIGTSRHRTRAAASASGAR